MSKPASQLLLCGVASAFALKALNPLAMVASKASEASMIGLLSAFVPAAGVLPKGEGKYVRGPRGGGAVAHVADRVVDDAKVGVDSGQDVWQAAGKARRRHAATRRLELEDVIGSDVHGHEAYVVVRAQVLDREGKLRGRVADVQREMRSVPEAGIVLSVRDGEETTGGLART